MRQSTGDQSMNDWRSKPRNGRAEFLKHEGFIQARMTAGETHKAVYQYLKDHEELGMSLSQFNRYINKLAVQGSKAPILKTPARTATKSAGETLSTTDLENPKKPKEENTDIPPANTSQKNTVTHEDLRKIRRDVDSMDLNALIQGKGVVFRKTPD